MSVEWGMIRTMELRVGHCPACGNVFQRNLRNLCSNCSAAEDNEIQTMELTLRRNRKLTNEELSEASGVPLDKLYGYIRSGKLRMFDYPNLADKCDRCGSAIRKGTMCTACTSRIREDIAHALKQEQLMKERMRANIYMSKK